MGHDAWTERGKGITAYPQGDRVCHLQIKTTHTFRDDFLHAPTFIVIQSPNKVTSKLGSVQKGEGEPPLSSPANIEIGLAVPVVEGGEAGGVCYPRKDTPLPEREGWGVGRRFNARLA